MYVPLATFAPALVVLSIAASACEDSSTAVRTGPSGTVRLESRLVSVEPAALVPEFLPRQLCSGRPPFQTRFNLFVHTERDLFLRQLRFEFRDRSGGRVLPLAIPTTVPLSPPTSHAVPVPVPGMLPFHGMVVSPPVRPLGLILNFDCDVLPEGTLFIDVETADSDGASAVSQVRVPIG
jgi:hypothetical protein